ncbi:ABC transporter substrate-binding protein [Streptomyces sp. NPDC051162]|uniref:nSTAND3 domain-containing NTPase n=1 Tax=Streptomyces sp. NPDC051162 TaxID=3154747 RepID=UPI003418F12D
MTPGFGTFVSDAHGAVHTGDGTQFNIYLQEATSRLRARGRTLRAFAADDLNRLYQCFVEPSRFDLARAALRTHGTVLLSGPPGSGRRTAALMLLHELGTDAAGFHELPDTRDDVDEPALDTSGIHDRGRLLLDLSNSDPDQYAAVQRELSGFRAELLRRAARLVVVLPQHLAYLQQDGLEQLTVEIGRPGGTEVLMRHLRLADIHPTRDELAALNPASYTASASMSELARFADRIRRARDSGPPHRGFPQWYAEALEALADRGPEVAAFVASLDTGRQRALALALAMLHGSAPDVVFHATAKLLTVVGHPEDDQPRLEHTDLTAEFNSIKAETGPDGLVRFRTPAYAAALRQHFWTYLPDLRSRFRDWVGQCVPELTLEAPERTALVLHFAGQCLRTSRPEDLWELAERWSRRDDSGRFMPDAAEALAEGLHHDRHGRAFRKWIYDKARTPALPTGLVQLLVVVCSEAMAATHPEQAVVRLHHLARRESEGRGRPAFHALTELACRDVHLVTLLLDRLAPEQWPVDGSIFYELAALVAHNRALHVNVSVRRRLTTGWTGVFRHRPDDEWSGHAEHWLGAACAAGTHSEPLLDVLVDAGSRSPGAFGRLHIVARDWSHARSENQTLRRALFSAFSLKLDTAQGVGIHTARA